MPAGSAVGASSWPCCSAIWGGRSRCARFAAGWRPARASCGTWGCPMRPAAPPWPTPTNIGLGSCIGACFINCWAAAARSPASHGFRFKNKLLTLDASLIELCASVFDWAQYQRTKGAVKLHLLLDHQGLLPSFAVMTEGRVHESRVARTLRFEPGTIVVFDRGYTDYDWFDALDEDGVFFVTRMKDNADYGVVERRPVPERGPVQRDEIIFLYKLARTGERDLFLRRIEVWDQQQQRTLVFLTNHRDFAASTIAPIYRSRWQIELFFKALKQNLHIKTFVGTTPNALQIQIWTALIALPHAQVSEVALQLRLEPIQSDCPVTPAVVRLSRPLAVDRSAFPATAAVGSRRPANSPLLTQFFWTAEMPTSTATPNPDFKNDEVLAIPTVRSRLIWTAVSQTTKYADGKTKDFYQIGISANTTGISVYVMGLSDQKGVTRRFGQKIGKASVTGYCIKFKTLADIKIDVLEAAIQYGIEHTSAQH